MEVGKSNQNGRAQSLLLVVFKPLFGTFQASFWYVSGSSKGKYRGTLQKPPRYFNKTSAVLLLK
jgi:hypothetical protein